jgi:hypothetical protein
MAVPAVNITIEQGTDFENVYTVTNPDGTPLDLTGYTANAKIRKYPSSSSYSSCRNHNFCRTSNCFLSKHCQ